MGLRSVYMSLGFPARTAAIGISGDVIVSTRLARAAPSTVNVPGGMPITHNFSGQPSVHVVGRGRSSTTHLSTTCHLSTTRHLSAGEAYSIEACPVHEIEDRAGA